MASSGQEIQKFHSSDFEQGDLIGRGGYGEVYLAVHKGSGKRVAIKTFINNGQITKRQQDSLLKEGKILSRVCKNKNIVQMFGLIMERNNYSLVTDYMALGNVLDFRIAYGPHWPLLVRLVLDIICGMQYLHDHDPLILHRDLKADNILINGQMRAKIADFGCSNWKTVSRSVTKPNNSYGGTGRMRCTVTHVPPELWGNIHSEQNTKYDVYSFSILLWEIFTGEEPFKGCADEVIKTCVLDGQRPDRNKIPTDCPEQLKRMMEDCWDHNYQNRPEFKDLYDGVNRLYMTEYEKHIGGTVKSIREQIVDECVHDTNDQAYIQTCYIDTLSMEDLQQQQAMEPEVPDITSLSLANSRNTNPTVANTYPYDGTTSEPFSADLPSLPNTDSVDGSVNSSELFGENTGSTACEFSGQTVSTSEVPDHTEPKSFMQSGGFESIDESTPECDAGSVISGTLSPDDSTIADGASSVDDGSVQISKNQTSISSKDNSPGGIVMIGDNCKLNITKNFY